MKPVYLDREERNEQRRLERIKRAAVECLWRTEAREIDREQMVEFLEPLGLPRQVDLALRLLSEEGVVLLADGERYELTTAATATLRAVGGA